MILTVTLNMCLTTLCHICHDYDLWLIRLISQIRVS